jgi:hypothetical protein
LFGNSAGVEFLVKENRHHINNVTTDDTHLILKTGDLLDILSSNRLSSLNSLSKGGLSSLKLLVSDSLLLRNELSISFTLSGNL